MRRFHEGDKSTEDTVMAPRLEGLSRSMTAVAEWSELTLPLSNLENCIMARLQTPRYWNFDHASESRIHIDANDCCPSHYTQACCWVSSKPSGICLGEISSMVRGGSWERKVFSSRMGDNRKRRKGQSFVRPPETPIPGAEVRAVGSPLAPDYQRSLI